MLKNSPFITAATFTAFVSLAFAQEAPPIATSPAASQLMAANKVEGDLPVDSRAGEKPRARTVSKPSPTPAPAAASAPEAKPTPKPKKPSFFQRFFGSRKRKPVATPTPEPSSTPTPTPRKSPRKPSSTPAPGSTPKPDQPAPAQSEVPKVAPATPPKKVPPIKPVASEPKKPVIEPPADADPDVKERFRFDQARGKAVEDPQIKSLKAKADDAATEEESRKALRAYNKALFEKIRKIDGTVAERADRMEAAILKRLSE